MKTVLVVLTLFLALNLGGPISVSGDSTGCPFYVRPIVDEINTHLKSQSATLDGKSYATGFQVFDWTQNGIRQQNANHFNIYRLLVTNLGTGIRDYSCTPFITDNGSAIRAKLILGNGLLKINTQTDFTGLPYLSPALDASIEDIVLNTLIWVDQRTHNFTVEQIDVENFRFKNMTYNPPSNPCCNNLEFTLTWLFGVKNYLNAEIRPELGKLLRKTFTDVTEKHTYDPDRVHKITELIHAISNELPTIPSLSETTFELSPHLTQEFKTGSGGTITVYHGHLHDLGHLEPDDSHYDLNVTFSGKWRLGGAQLRMNLSLDIALNEWEDEHQVDELRLLVPMEPIVVEYVIRETVPPNPLVLTLVEIKVSPLQFKTPVDTSAIVDTTARQAVEQHVVPLVTRAAGGAEPTVFEKLSDAARKHLVDLISKFVHQKLATIAAAR